MENELSWISDEKLIELAIKRFQKAIRQQESAENRNLHTDPTLVILRSVLAETDAETNQKIDSLISTTKTLQNAIGLFHQDVLGSVDGWESTGSNGGLVDLHSEKPVALTDNKFVLAEIKMRHNTIKASDEKNVFDQLRNAYIVFGRDTHVAYLFQLVPQNEEPYDKPWKVSGREIDPNVRVADGTTAYHIVTGDPNALFDLMKRLPHIFGTALERILGQSKDFNLSASEVEKAIFGALAIRSFHSQ